MKWIGKFITGKYKGRSVAGKHNSHSISDATKVTIETHAATHHEDIAWTPLGKLSPGEAILRRARRDIGKHESPRGSNSGPFVTPILKRAGCPDHEPWCAAWDTGVIADARDTCPDVLPIIITAGCGTLRAWATEHDRWVHEAPGVHPKPGWLFVFTHDRHTGIVASATATHISGPAGNTSRNDGTNVNGGEVAEHPIPRNLIAGYVITHGKAPHG